MTNDYNKPHDCADHGCLAAMLGLATDGTDDDSYVAEA